MKANTGLRFAMMVLVFAMLVAVIPVSQPAHAAGPWYVAPGGNDSNDCLDSTTACTTINSALNKPGFVAGDTVRVAIGTYTGTGDEVVLLSKSATLSGGWNNTFTTQTDTSTIDGQTSRCGIMVNPYVTATVENFDIRNGSSGYCGGIAISMGGYLILNNSIIGGNFGGGGIYNDAGTVILNNSIVSRNSGYAGGIHNNGTMTLNYSFVDSNTVRPGAGGAGGILNQGTLTLNNSVVSNNTSTDGYGYGGIHNYYGTLTLDSSSVSGNTPGGIENSGTLTLDNTTVSGNTSYEGGGIRTWAGTLTLNSSTVSGNMAGQGGGIFNYSTSVTLRNSIVAGNTGTSPDCSGPIASAGYNLIGNTSGCSLTPGPGDLTNIDPRLGPLMGSPGYHPLLPGSPAIDAANPAGCTDHLGQLLSTDQRGTPRPLDGNGDSIAICDIGAYESDPANPIRQVFLPITVRNYCPVLLYTDDFSDPGSGWPIAETQNTLYAYLNGEYRILVKSTGWSAGAGPGFKASDYIVAVDVRNVTGVYGSYGIIFGLSDDWRQFYTFEVDPSSNYVIWRYNSKSGWTSLASGSSGYINPGTATNRLKIERNGSLIRAYVNGQLLTSVSDGSYTGLRHVGLIVSSYDQPNVDARFDNFVVYPVTCGAGAAALREGSEASRGKIMEADLSGSNRFRVVERQERRLDLDLDR